MAWHAQLKMLSDGIEGQRGKIVPFAILMAIFLAFYLGEMATFTLSIDEEFAAIRTDPAAWLGQGRWMLFLLEAVMPQPTVPYFPLFFFGLCCSAAYILLTEAFRIGLAGATPYLLFPLFCGFPTLFFILDFSANVPGVAVGILAGCISVLSFAITAKAWAEGRTWSASRLTNTASQIGFSAVAIGCYETFALFILFGYAAVIIDLFTYSERRPKARFALSIHLYGGAMLVAAAVLSRVATEILAQMQGVSVSAYANGFMRLDKLRTDPLAVIGKSFSEYSKVYLGSDSVYGFSYRNFAVLPMVGAIAVAGRLGRREVMWKSLAILYLAAMTFIPFLLHVLAGGALPYRTIVSVQFVFWFFAVVAAKSHILTLRWLAIGLSAVTALQALYTFSVFQAGKRLVYQHDVQLASQLYDRIAQQAQSFDRDQPYFVDIFGAHGFQTFYPEIPSSTWSASFFEWDGGNVPRMITFMQILGYSNVRTMGTKESQLYYPEMLEMPVWPDRGSVRVHGSDVLVKLGEVAGYSHRGLPGSTR